MKTMNNFAAQQLTKKQMNEVKGGAQFLCMCYRGNKPLTTTPQIPSVFTVDDAKTAIFLVQVSCPNGGRCDAL